MEWSLKGLGDKEGMAGIHKIMEQRKIKDQEAKALEDKIRREQA